MTELSMSLAELTQAVSVGLANASRKPNILNYRPHPKQLDFHMKKGTGRLYIGGNRSGKTVAGVCEDIWWLTGRHPYQKVPEPPTFGRLVTVDFKNGVEKIILPVLRQWLPVSELRDGSWERSYNKNLNVLTLRNGSKLEIMSHEQPLEKFAGTSRHFLHMDEECPESIFKESKVRLIDTSGHWWMTMTPVEGMTWVFEQIFDAEDPNIDIITVDIDDNPYLPQSAKDEILSGLSEEDQKIRGRGEFVAIGGLVLREFDYSRHVIKPRLPPRSWRVFGSIDHGYNNPTAILYHGISPDGHVVTFAEHYRAEWTVKQHAQKIKEMNDAFRRDPDIWIGDPAMQQRQAVTGHSIRIEYSMSGVPVALGKNNVLAGLDKMNMYLQQDKWFITQNCNNLLKEIRKYRWKSYTSAKLKDMNNKREEPQKKDDHAIDSCRYMFSFMPNLGKYKPTEIKRVDKEEIVKIMEPGTTFDPARRRVFPWNVDPNLQRVPSREYGFGENE